MESTTTKEDEKNILATAIEKINTFLENAGAWNKKLVELFKDSQSHAQLIKDMADSYKDLKNLAEALENQIERDKDLKQEMEGLKTNISEIEKHTVGIKESKQQVTKLLTSTNINFNNLTEKIYKLEQGTEKHELVNDLAKDMATFNQKIISLEEAVGQHATRLMEENTKQSTTTNLEAEIAKQATRIQNLTNSLQKLEIESSNSNIIGNNYILSKFIGLFVSAAHFPNFNAFKKSINNSSETIEQKLTELYTKACQKQITRI